MANPSTANPFAGLALDQIPEASILLRPNKRRSTQDTASISLKPDLEAAELSNGMKFVAIVDLAKLDPNWGTGIHANRSLVDKHVDALIQQIKQSDRRYDQSNRCQASAPEAIIELLIQRVEVEKQALLQNYQANTPEELVVIEVDTNTIKLEAGQHRRAAVLRLNDLSINSTSGVFLSDNLKRTKLCTMWPVEFYSTEFLEAHPLAQIRLRYNTDTTKSKSSFGDDMAVIHKAWGAMDDQTRNQILSLQKTFVDFLNRLLPGNTSVISWLPLLKHNQWRFWIERFVSFPWGRATVVASQFTVAFACHHPRPFFRLFEDITQWLERYFPGIYHLIDAEDMNLLIERSTCFASSSNLRALFFPVWPEDFNFTMRLKVTGDTYRLNIQKLKACQRNNSDPGFPPLNSPVVINGVTYSHRRPDFLSALSDQQYYNLFQRLRNLDETAAFPNWAKVMREDTQHTCHVFTSVMRHLISWTDPAAKPPSSNSSNVISYTWDDLVVSHAMPHRKLSQVFVPDTTIRHDARLSAQEMIDHIWMHCSTYNRDFLADDVRSTLGSDVVSGELKEITEQTAFDYLGPAFSSETFMQHFNNPAKIQEARLP